MTAWRDWFRDGVQRHIGRLILMAVGVGVIGYGLVDHDSMSDAESVAALIVGAAMLSLGYMSPYIKRMMVRPTGFEFEANDRTLELNREAAEEITNEIESGEGVQIDEDETVTGARFYVAEMAIQSMFTETPGGIELFVYLMDDEVGGLTLAMGTDPQRLADQPPWPPGVGAVGKAYSTGEFIVAIGDEAHDSTHGLSAEQQAQHADTVAVAATPIINASGRIIGVLAASERGKPVDECMLAQEWARGMLLTRADGCARILVDLLGFFADDV